MHEYISQTHVNPPAGYICILASNIIKTGIKQIEVSFSHPIVTKASFNTLSIFVHDGLMQL